MGRLEIIDALCDITRKQADIINEMAEAIEQADVASAVKDGLSRKKKECEDMLSSTENRIRRL